MVVWVAPYHQTSLIALERESFSRESDRSPLTLLTSSHSYPQGVSAQKVMMVLFYHHSLFDHYLEEEYV